MGNINILIHKIVTSYKHYIYVYSKILIFSILLIYINPLSSHAGLKYFGGLSFKAGSFTKFELNDSIRNEWNGFDGYPSLGISTFLVAKPSRFVIRGSMAIDWLYNYLGMFEDFSTKSLQADEVGGSILISKINVDYSIPIIQKIEIRPQIGYTWESSEARVWLRDSQSGQLYKVVDQTQDLDYINIGLVFNRWNSTESLKTQKELPNIEIEIQYAPLLKRIFHFNFEWKFHQDYNPRIDKKVYLALLGRFNAGQSVNLSTIGLDIGWGNW
jgi:hypothetical protein